MIAVQDNSRPDLPSLEDGVSLLRAVPDRDALLQSVIRLLQGWTGCQSVGVRLCQGEDYPYYTTLGFSEEFVRLESGLCARESSGEPVRDAAGRVVLECLCGAVIAGRFDPSQPFFTERGSFFTGSTSRLLAEAAAIGLPARTRNRCNASGYETVVLTPLRAGGRTFGLIQVNDRRKDCLDRVGVEGLERLAEGLATLLSRQETHAALTEAEARYRAVFTANIAVKLLIDPETGAIVEANPAASAFYGYSPEAMRGLFIWDINTMPQEMVCREMRAANEVGRKFFRFTHRVADGGLREVEVYTGPVEFSGRTLLFSIIHDVTDRVRAEEARERVEQMLRHDLRSPLAGIAGMANHLAEAGLCPEGQEMAEVIRETAVRLYTLVGRNLDLLKIEQGRYVLTPSPVLLAPMLQGLAREAASLAVRRKATLILVGPGLSEEGDGPAAAGEAGLLAAMFSNLVTNALEAAPSGSDVSIVLAALLGEATITLHNQGAVPKDIRPRFFTKYATSGKKGGTGLGAYLARAIARLHGGDIDWESSEASGTRLTVRLPLVG